MTLHDFILFTGVAAVVAVIAHAIVRRFWIAVFGSAVIASLVNIGHEVFVHRTTIRPADIMFLFVVFVPGIVAALPAAVLIGLPFHLVRLALNRRRQRNAA